MTLVKRFKDVEREIKTYLGGRAAEELFHNENVGLESARSDLRYALLRNKNGQKRVLERLL